MNRDVLISYIKENDPFYCHASLSGYSTEELAEVKERISRKVKNGKCPVCNGRGLLIDIECATCAGTGAKPK